MDKEDKHLDGAGLGKVWAKCKNYFLAKGGGTMTGALTVPSLAINSTTAAAHLAFTGVSAKYITVPSGQTLTVSMNGNVGNDASGYIFTGTAFMPKASSTYYLGGSANRWQAIYGVGLSLTGSASVGTTLSVGGATTLSSTVTISDHVFMANNKEIGWKKNPSGEYYNILSVNASNEVILGYSNNSTARTGIYGATVRLYAMNTEKVVVDTSGLTSYGGVAAMGIADLSIN